MDLKTKKLVKELIKLVVQNKIDFLEVGTIKIQRSYHHRQEEKPVVFEHSEAKEMSEEEALFWSTR